MNIKERSPRALLGDFRSPRQKVEGYWVTIDLDLRACILGKTQGDCIYCWRELNFERPRGINPLGFTVDHFVPKVLGGSPALWNLVPACFECNCMKGGIHPKDWLSPETYRILPKELGINLG